MKNPITTSLACLLISANFLVGQTDSTWTGRSGNGLWSDPGNWGNGGPRDGGTAHFIGEPSTPIRIDSDAPGADRINLFFPGIMTLEAEGGGRVFAARSVPLILLKNKSIQGIRFTGAHDLALRSDSDFILNFNAMNIGRFAIIQESAGTVSLAHAGDGLQVRGLLLNWKDFPGINDLHIEGDGSGELVLGHLMQNNTQAPVAVTVTRGRDTVTRWVGENTYAGPTTVESGILLVDGSTGLPTGSIRVQAGGAIGGSGALGGPLHLESGAGLYFDPESSLRLQGQAVDLGALSFADLRNLDQNVPAGTFDLLVGGGDFQTGRMQNLGRENAATFGGGRQAYFQIQRVGSTQTLQIVISR